MLTFQNLHLIVAAISLVAGGVYYAALPDPVIAKPSLKRGVASATQAGRSVRVVY